MLGKALVAGSLACLVCASTGGNVFESFDDGALERWIKSGNARYAGSNVELTDQAAGVEGDKGLRVVTSHKHYGLSNVLPTAVSPGHEDGFVVQYEVKYNKGVTCSGAYLKLLIKDDSFDGTGLEESSPYSIMFGPDVCGSTNKVHLIFRAENPVTGEFEEKHMKTVVPAEKNDQYSHLYTLELKADDSFVVKVDGVEKSSGKLTSDSDFEPSFQPPKTIPDAEEKKPADWVDDEMMGDPEDIKPEGWDDIPAEIADPSASQPEDWDEEDDGEWEAPTIANPDYKGPWVQKKIANPDYKGPWAPQQIPNPEYFDASNPVRSLKPIGAVSIEILANDAGIQFDSVMIGNDLSQASEYASTTFAAKQAAEKASAEKVANEAKEEERAKALEEGGYVELGKLYMQDLADTLGIHWQTNPIPVVLGGLSIVAMLFFTCFRGSSKSGDSQADHKKDDDAAEPEDDGDEEEDEEEEEEDEEEEEEEEDKGAKRRIPKKK